MAIKVHGGIITDDMLKGSFSYFSIAGDFAYTVSDGAVIIPGAEVEGGDPNAVNEFFVGAGKPVPGSTADHVLRAILERCTIVQIKLVATGTDGSGAAGTSEIQIAVEKSSNGWHSVIDGVIDPITMLDASSDAASNMQDVIIAMPDVIVPDLTNTGTSSNFAGVTVTLKEFLLA